MKQGVSEAASASVFRQGNHPIWWTLKYSYSESLGPLTYNSCTRGAGKSLAQPGKKQARKHVRNARDFNKIETRAFIKFVFLQGKAPKEIHAVLAETLACFLPGRAKDLSAPLYLRRPPNFVLPL